MQKVRTKNAKDKWIGKTEIGIFKKEFFPAPGVKKPNQSKLHKHHQQKISLEAAIRNLIQRKETEHNFLEKGDEL